MSIQACRLSYIISKSLTTLKLVQKNRTLLYKTKEKFNCYFAFHVGYSTSQMRMPYGMS